MIECLSRMQILHFFLVFSFQVSDWTAKRTTSHYLERTTVDATQDLLESRICVKKDDGKITSKTRTGKVGKIYLSLECKYDYMTILCNTITILYNTISYAFLVEKFSLSGFFSPKVK